MIESNIYLEMILHTNLDLTQKRYCGNKTEDSDITILKTEISQN